MQVYECTCKVCGNLFESIPVLQANGLVISTCPYCGQKYHRQRASCSSHESPAAREGAAAIPATTAATQPAGSTMGVDG